MPAVRRRYHYANLVLNPYVVGKDKSVCGNNVEVIYSDGRSMMLALGDFMDEEQAKAEGLPLVEVNDIVAFSEDSSGFGTFEDVKGLVLSAVAHSGRRVHILLKDGRPIVTGPHAIPQLAARCSVVRLHPTSDC